MNYYADLKIMKLLAKCKCNLCQKELKRLEDKYKIKQKVNKGQAVFLNHPKEKDLKEITLHEFEIQLMELVRKDVQPERLNPEDIKPFDGILSPNWLVNLVNVCDSPNCENK